MVSNIFEKRLQDFVSFRNPCVSVPTCTYCPIEVYIDNITGIYIKHRVATYLVLYIC